MAPAGSPADDVVASRAGSRNAGLGCHSGSFCPDGRRTTTCGQRR